MCIISCSDTKDFWSIPCDQCSADDQDEMTAIYSHP